MYWKKHFHFYKDLKQTEAEEDVDSEKDGASLLAQQPAGKYNCETGDPVLTCCNADNKKNGIEGTTSATREAIALNKYSFTFLYENLMAKLIHVNFRCGPI